MHIRPSWQYEHYQSHTTPKSTASELRLVARLLRAAATLFTWNSSYNQVIITRSCLTSTSVSMLVTEPAVPDSSFLAVRLR